MLHLGSRRSFFIYFFNVSNSNRPRAIDKDNIISLNLNAMLKIFLILENLNKISYKGYIFFKKFYDSFKKIFNNLLNLKINNLGACS